MTMGSVTLLGKPIARDDVLAALRQFDSMYPDPNDYDRWLDKRNYHYALRYRGRLYPCKYILSVASGWALTEFSGGEETNSKFCGLCFEVIDKP